MQAQIYDCSRKNIKCMSCLSFASLFSNPFSSITLLSSISQGVDPVNDIFLTLFSIGIHGQDTEWWSDGRFQGISSSYCHLWQSLPPSGFQLPPDSLCSVVLALLDKLLVNSLVLGNLPSPTGLEVVLPSCCW